MRHLAVDTDSTILACPSKCSSGSPHRCGGRAWSAPAPGLHWPVSLSVAVSLRRLWDSMFPPSFPPLGLTFRTPFPPPGRLGRLPRLHRYYGVLRCLQSIPAASGFPWQPVPALGDGFCSTNRITPSLGGRGPWSSVDRPDSSRRRQETLPGFWGTHMHACPALRPRWDGLPLP
jgi:hypothetical protein